jgi:hypothetical protein
MISVNLFFQLCDFFEHKICWANFNTIFSSHLLIEGDILGLNPVQKQTT